MPEWAAISFSRGSSRPRDQTASFALPGGFLITEPPGKPFYLVAYGQAYTHEDILPLQARVLFGYSILGVNVITSFLRKKNEQYKMMIHSVH